MSTLSSRVPSLASNLASSTAQHPVLHRIAQPVSVSEFSNALREAAPPRFPHLRVNHSVRVNMAISGGVDSMALAYLCARAHVTTPWLKVADTGCGGFRGLIVDHGLRANSAAEAQAVQRALVGMGHRAEVLPLRDDEGELFPFGVAGGRGEPGKAKVPKDGPAMETLARRWRYRTLGRALARFGQVSLLLAHHADDQYETVLMRLLSGAGMRGLRGMRAASDLPECHDMYGAYQSGYLDDKYSSWPTYSTRPTTTQKRDMRREFRREERKMALMLALEGLDDDTDSNKSTYSNARAYPPDYWDELTYMYQVLGRPAPLLPTIETEDLGVMVYRPLLPFPKDRLIATCLANNVPWFEDHTNADPTLTTRNALRHIAKNHTLPEALQKPAILRLSARCDAACCQHEAEARRLILRHRVVVQFTANVGTVVARLPRLQPKTRRRRCRGNRQERDFYTALSVEKRRLYLRNVAGLVVQKLLSYVTPETNVTPVSQLQTVIDTLFPDLVDPKLKSKKAKTDKAPDPSAFVICGVHFMPFVDKDKPESEPTRSWYLARAPYISPENALGRGIPHVPSVRFQSLGNGPRLSLAPDKWQWSKWSDWKLYDGRFWVRLRTRLPTQVVLQPFDKDYSKDFREALKDKRDRQPSSSYDYSSFSSSDNSRLSRFLAILKTYAPGKVRYTLPAIYALADVSWALEGRPYWPAAAARMHYRKDPANPARHVDANLTVSTPYSQMNDPDDDFANNFDGLTEPVYRNTGRRVYDMITWDRHMRVWERKKREALYETSNNPVRPAGIVLALPTIDACVPGIEQWLKWEVRYRKVDRGVLDSIEQDMLAERMYDYESRTNRPSRRRVRTEEEERAEGE